MNGFRFWVWLSLFSLAQCLTAAYANAQRLSTVHLHTPDPRFQQHATCLYVLLPDGYNQRQPYRVLYLLPVASGNTREAIDTLAALNIHNRYQVIIAQPTFSDMPWYGDHATDSSCRQASYLRHAVVPLVDSLYATVRRAEGRLLLGFSKSGWGAFSLIARYPDFFGYAASWDAPRLVLAGEQAWGQLQPSVSRISHTREMHDLLKNNAILFRYDPSLRCTHNWNREWLEPVIGYLMQLTD
jgi:S-formylglutathione hydrolase FrmB